MKPGARVLRTLKEERLACTPAHVSSARSRSLHPLARILRKGCARKTLFAEIHAAAQYNGSTFDETIEHMVRMYDTHADAIVIVTDDVLFHGEVGWIERAAALTQKPIIVLDLIISEQQIRHAYTAGADAIVLIASILETDELHRLYDFAKSLDIDVIVEVQDESELADALSCHPDLVGINTRDIENLAEVDMHRIAHLASLVPDDVHIIAESGIKSVYDIRRYCDAASAVVVGSSILESRNPEGSLAYFARQGVSEPALMWVRPPAFLFGRRLPAILQMVTESGLQLVHTFKVLRTPYAYAEMYAPKFRLFPTEGRKFYAVINAALEEVRKRGGDPQYSEAWLLEPADDLPETLHKLEQIKHRIRLDESVPVATTMVEGESIEVLLHSIHVPDANRFDNVRDISVLSRFREHRRALVDYL